MNPNQHPHDESNADFLHRDLTYSIVGAGFEVHKGLGPGIWEKPYENAMVVELGIRKHAIDQQRRFDLIYKGVHVGEFVPDLIVDENVIVDTKVINEIGPYEKAQMLNYLRITRLRIGLIINFKNTSLEWLRVAL